MSNSLEVQDAPVVEPISEATTNTVAVLVADATYRRLLEGITINLDLTPVFLDDADLDSGRICDFELIIADEAIARSLCPLLKSQQRTSDEIYPALIAVVPGPVHTSFYKDSGSEFDAVLAMPERPTMLAAQLGVALYAHRAFARRYRSALEELTLNRNIFKSVTSGISVADAQHPDMPLLYVNPAFEVMTGYSLEDIQGQNCRFLQREDRNQPGVTLIREALAQQRETVAVLRNYGKDGSSFWNELALSPIRNREGVVTHFVGIQMDVTERVEFEIALRESEKLAAVGRLASSIAHEINNPLEAVMNLVYLSLQTLPELPPNVESRQYLSQVDQQLQRIKLITVQSLRFYKQSNGPEAVTCTELLNPILDIYSSRFDNYNITVEKRERSSQHLVCLASEIRQVLSNLISNAIDATRSGGRIIVHTREATDWKRDRKGVLITVADTGKGMSPQTQANIYKAFYTTKGISGTGLGLWISSEIVHRHHGRLHCRSRQTPGSSGTVFELFLPYQAASGEDKTLP